MLHRQLQQKPNQGTSTYLSLYGLIVYIKMDVHTCIGAIYPARELLEHRHGVCFVGYAREKAAGNPSRIAGRFRSLRSNAAAQPPSRSRTNSLTSAGFTLLPDWRITWPTKKPRRPVLPARYSSALAVLTAMTRSTNGARAPGSLSWRSFRYVLERDGETWRITQIQQRTLLAPAGRAKNEAGGAHTPASARAGRLRGTHPHETVADGRTENKLWAPPGYLTSLPRLVLPVRTLSASASSTAPP
jgi:hypothetical protein